MAEYTTARRRMVAEQIHARGVRDPKVLAAMGRVPRELFVAETVRRHAYEDRPLPIAAGQTISQPYIVAFMVEALALPESARVLEVGTGSGYAAAVLAELGAEVVTIERIDELADAAAQSVAEAGYRNVTVIHGDGTRGWVEAAPYDGILVSAGGPSVPESLMRQLAVGGRLVVPVGTDPRLQELVRVTRIGEDSYDREDLADVRFVPLIGAEGWEAEEPAPESTPARVVQARPRVSQTLPGLISASAEVFENWDNADLEGLLGRIGDARVVLIGEASHGTSEFYRLRARITRQLIERRGFTIVAAEADWPDAARIDHYVRHADVPPAEWTAFARFPTWMWRNQETREFVDWLHEYNATLPFEQRTAFRGLDLYSLFSSVRAVIDYLTDIDPELADVARTRYGCLSPWETDPAAYGHAALTGRYHECETEVVRVLDDLLRRRWLLAERDPDRFLDAEQNARVVAQAERYYRVMYYGSRASWNLRDSHMFNTLERLLDHHGEGAKAVVWAHNSHIGDARATEMSARGEHNIGQLCVQAFGEDAYRIGFGTDRGTVAAASHWDGPMEIKRVVPSHRQSYERQFHLTNAPGLLLPLRHVDAGVTADLAQPRLERAIGVIYRPESELASHYFEAVLPRQFDEYVWVDETTAVNPIITEQLTGLPDTYPFGV
ncbi:MAG: protein-L-isoaspartate(D-aspartate) O-methyltransferase [Gammaproteobacteria bacterium]|nr:protein-L-isoaspartate(D-aspartate) O-methyltransferase [Gammaproteobacteria bacterium]